MRPGRRQAGVAGQGLSAIVRTRIPEEVALPNMLVDDRVFIGVSTCPEYLALKYANRHGLITGATGTGKTVTLQGLAEGFSRAGVPVFLADVKGDLAGIAATGEAKDFLVKRAKDIGFDDWTSDKFPTIFWDLFGRQGHPVRATISEMGPLLIARLLDLNDTQEGVLNVAFKVADDNGSLLLLDLKDLRALLVEVERRSSELSATYGNIATATVGAVQRALLVLEQQGGANFFGEKALEIADLMRIAPDGRGIVSILAADQLMNAPRLYATFLLWMLSELFEALPEVGDPPKPKLVFFFDEAHRLLFDDAPEGAGRQGRAGGGQARALERRRRLFLHPEPGRRARRRALAARQSRPARPARLHPARAAGGQGRGRNLPPQSRLQHRRGDIRTRHRRGAGLDAGGRRRALDRQPHVGPPALVARRPADPG